MENNDIIQLIRHYRHDIMNHLQIIHGYTGMGKYDKAQNKLDSYLKILNEEGKLLKLNAADFTLYIMQLPILYSNIRLSYQIDIEDMELYSINDQLFKRSQEVLQILQNVIVDNKLYDLFIQLYYDSENGVMMDFILYGDVSNVSLSCKNKDSIENGITVYEAEEYIKCIVFIPYKWGE